ncbi:two-component regulator propeller domain-containing protein [Tamlana sp. 2_MG-2023]|uniref:hybrid sensor histidine kinase/response regulator transcription factor n=1 Tax=unclassified Tamlana TaxID=2614803 RepID=UPI0026E17EA3|nr:MULTISPECIES: two-component regulator propeller domain-containing protein [unclassified Tamlana]MDO6760957.1 two-component regulator propeller domain-containing protein [Tamlana sp. 2_MG-2023]MDO6791213.1 two-component regulator propeller domain-containing protein [Tamlana sp. 1_MG-2023]
MFKNKYFPLLLVFTFCSLFAQNKQLEYSKQLSIYEGLAHNGVTSILEDSKGFLWFGTYDGLNKYDGYSLKTFKNTIDKTILVSNRVRTIAEDPKGNLWIGTDEGLSIYNYEKEQFKNIYSNGFIKKEDTGPIIRKILFDNENDLAICASEGNGLLLFNQDYSFIEKHYLYPNSKNTAFYNGIKLDKNHYIFTSSSGLVVFNIKTKKFEKVLDNQISLSKPSSSIIAIKDNKLLVTLNSGIAVINYKFTGKTYNFSLDEIKLPNQSFATLTLDINNSLWLGSITTGVVKINSLDTFLDNKTFKKEFFHLESGLTRTSFIAPSTYGSCWVATFNEGLFQFNIDENPFKGINAQMNMPHGIKTNHVTSISPYNKEKVFVSTNNNGIYLFNSKTERFEPLPFKIPSHQFETSTSVFVDSNKNIWFKINGYGLCRVKAGKTNFDKIFKIGDKSFDDMAPRSYTEDKNGNIWIGCAEDVYKISIDKNDDIINIESLNQNHPLFKNNKLKLARRVYTDPLHNYIWLGADANGLFRIKIGEANEPVEDLKIDQYLHDNKNKKSISSNFVTSMVRLPNEEFWVGTEGGGLCKVLNSDKKPYFTPLSEKNGLSNNVIKNILFDKEHNLWVTTNIGLNKIDTKDLSIRKFTRENGLPYEDFWFAGETLENNLIVLSSLDGFCYFNPEMISNKESLPKLEFEDLKVFNKFVLPGDTISNRVLLDKRLAEMNEIILKYNENVFSIGITSLHFSNPDNHGLRYKLIPINDEWIEVPSSQHNISYNGLQPGNYTLSVMASNSLNKWTEPKNLIINITPPFWKTTQAYLLYFLIASLLAFVVVKIILRIQTLNHNLEIEHLEKDNEKKINDEKLRFFSNISHEIKTPLTLISGPISILLNRFKNNQDVKEKLEIVERQSKKISRLIDQVHDFQKAEAKVLKMNYSRFYFNTFINELVGDFAFFAQNENKKLEIKDSGENIIVSADKDKLEKVFNNIINNAFKYTEPNDAIKIEFYSSDKDLSISISDTGKGIDEKDLSHIFERFYQSHKYENIHSSGSGIGLAFSKLLVEMHYGYISAESELGKGSVFNIKLPIVKKHTSDEQKEIEKTILSAEKDFEISTQLMAKNNPQNITVDSDLSETLIFYAEDNLDMRLYVTDALSKFFRIKSFSNGQECLDAMEDEWPDIVISDVQMPELNGLDLCRTIKADIKTSHIPIILLTALTNIEDTIRGIRDGADAYINKPFNVQHLITRTESLLNNRKQLRERFQIGIPLTKENNLNNRNDNAFLEKLYSLIAENLDNSELDLNQFAKELYLNRTHFFQKVKALTNQSPFELLKAFRLKKAAEYLSVNKLPVNEVFTMTGFKSRTHFSKSFKEQYNVTPGKYASSIEEKYKSS